MIMESTPKAAKRIFKIFIELAQNVSIYSAEKNIATKKFGIGSLVVTETSGYYYFYTGNIVENKDISPLINRCEIINSLNIDGLRKYKRAQLELPDNDRGGANIGLIQVAIASSNPLSMEFSPIDKENSFFAVSVKVLKE